MQPTTPQDHKPKRFTTKRRDVVFYIDDDEFNGIPSMPVMTAIELSELQGELQGASGVKAKMMVAISIFEIFLQPDSFKHFNARLSDKENPIDLHTLIDVIQWIVGEAYGLRPTQKSPASTSSQSDTGQASTVGAPPEVSTPSISTGADISI